MNNRHGKTCFEQDCRETIPTNHWLCGPHFNLYKEEKLGRCPNCDAYKPIAFPLCQNCNQLRKSGRKPPQQGGTGSARNGAPQKPPTRTPSQQPSNRPRPASRQTAPTWSSNRPAPTVSASGQTGPRYERVQDEDDPKAEDKRYWFNRQNNGVCNYCGNRQPYSDLQMEHLIPRDLGGPDHWRNTQLACRSCNLRKGTATDLEFREINRGLLPQQERTPANPPIDSNLLREGIHGHRYRGEARQIGPEGRNPRAWGNSRPGQPADAPEPGPHQGGHNGEHPGGKRRIQ